MVSSPLPSPGHQLVRPAGRRVAGAGGEEQDRCNHEGASARIAAPTVPRRDAPNQAAGCSVLRCVTAIAAPTQRRAGGDHERLAPARRAGDRAGDGVAQRDPDHQRGDRPRVGLGHRALGRDLADDVAARRDQRRDRQPADERERRHHRRPIRATRAAGSRAAARPRSGDSAGTRAASSGARRRGSRPTPLPNDQIASSSPAVLRVATSSQNAGNVTSTAPKQNPTGNVAATRVRTPERLQRAQQVPRGAVARRAKCARRRHRGQRAASR